jgi:hypothetical protein
MDGLIYDPEYLSSLPLSAYTPGQGDPKMEGGWATATGAPMYTYEMWRAGTLCDRRRQQQSPIRPNL